jgi:hypothetical protein
MTFLLYSISWHNFPHILHLQSHTVLLRSKICKIRGIIITNFNQYNNIIKNRAQCLPRQACTGASQNVLWSKPWKFSVWTVLTSVANLLLLRWTTDVWISAIHRALCSPWLLLRLHHYSICLYPKKSMRGVTVAILQSASTQTTHFIHDPSWIHNWTQVLRELQYCRCTRCFEDY